MPKPESKGINNWVNNKMVESDWFLTAHISGISFGFIFLLFSYESSPGATFIVMIIKTSLTEIENNELHLCSGVSIMLQNNT